jgi:hypothetical protein
MNAITEEKTEKYIYSLLPARDAVLRDMERYAARYDVPIIGPACGRLLYHSRKLFTTIVPLREGFSVSQKLRER